MTEEKVHGQQEQEELNESMQEAFRQRDKRKAKEMENNKKAIVWSNVGCSYCEQAKRLLKSKNIEYEERNIATSEWTVQHLQEAVPGARTVPQIFVDGQHVGGYNELVKHLG